MTTFEDATERADEDYEEAIDEVEEESDGLFEESFDDYFDELEEHAASAPDEPVGDAVRHAIYAYTAAKILVTVQKLEKQIAHQHLTVMRKSLVALNRFTTKTKVARQITAHQASAIVGEHAAGLRKNQQASLAALATGMTERAKSVVTATGIGPKPLIEHLKTVVFGERWRAHRIVVTEASHVYNRIAAVGMRVLAHGNPALWMRWTERIDDAGRVLDKRVAQDSIVMHGQIAKPGGMFRMPPDAGDRGRVSSKLLGMFWPHPPNRPHDRAILTPWTEGCGQPAWIWRDGRQDLS